MDWRGLNVFGRRAKLKGWTPVELMAGSQALTQAEIRLRATAAAPGGSEEYARMATLAASGVAMLEKWLTNTKVGLSDTKIAQLRMAARMYEYSKLATISITSFMQQFGSLADEAAEVEGGDATSIGADAPVEGSMQPTEQGEVLNTLLLQLPAGNEASGEDQSLEAL